MAALDFPASPTNGQVYGQYTYDSTKGAWRVTAANGATAVASPTAPTSPVAGNLWYNTNDGIMFMYYADGDSSQWVEVKANSSLGSTVPARVDALELADASTNKSGLVPVVPTSVSVSSGSATIGTTGLVTLTSGSQVVLRNCFSSAYTDYVVLVSMTPATNTRISCRFAVSGTPDSTSSYNTTNLTFWQSGTGVGGTLVNAPAVMPTTGAVRQTVRFQMFKPYPANQNAIVEHFSTMDIDQIRFGQIRHTSSSNRDGFAVFTEDGNAMSGTIQVYGYR